MHDAPQPELFFAGDAPSLPALRGPADWRAVPIDPVDEPLVEVRDLGARLIDDPRYHSAGLPGTRQRTLIREGVGDRLVRVAGSLPDGVRLVVWDGWRAFATQEALYLDWRQQLQGDHPDWSAERLDAETARYVSVPSVRPECPAPHVTGGAVDVTLADGDGRVFDLGTAFDAFVPEAAAVALEDVPGDARELRRRLFWAMADAGFTAYVEEWWHFDYGDQFWGSVCGCPARYGPIAPAD